MLSFGRLPIPPGCSGKVYVHEEEQAVFDSGRQQRSRYYAAVLPAAVTGPPRRSSQPFAGAAIDIPSASSSNAVSRFARTTAAPYQHASHSLPSVHRRSQPIDIPAVRRSSHSQTATAVPTRHWSGMAWQAAADETDGSSSGSGGSECSDDSWCVDGGRGLSQSFVDDSQLQWSGRCLEDGSAEVGALGRRKELARWSGRGRAGDSDEENDAMEDEDAGSVLPFPLMAPSYHVDFELN